MFSLIVATMNRVSELDRLLTSLGEQSYKDFEVIIVDQNGDDRLSPLVSNHRGMAIRHVRSERGLSRARNAGLQVARGDIIAIPDDDCWYPEGVLAVVQEWFESHPQFDLLLGITHNAEGKPMLPRWPPSVGAL